MSYLNDEVKSVRVLVDRTDGFVRSVLLVGSDGTPVDVVCRFLDYLLETGGSPNTASAYAHDLKYLFEFCEERDLDWTEFGPAVTLICSVGCGVDRVAEVCSNRPRRLLNHADAFWRRPLLLERWRLCLASTDGPLLQSDSRMRILCTVGGILHWLGFRVVISPSWAERVVSCRLGVRCGFVCLHGCRGPWVVTKSARCWTVCRTCGI